LDQASFVTFFELATKIANVDRERIGARIEVVAPHEVKDLISGEDLTGML
jgi:hypothetical protein